VIGYHPTTNRGDQGSVMSPNGMTNKSMEPGAALQPEMLANPTPKYNKPRNLPTHHATIPSKFAVIDKKMRYKKR